MPSSGVKELDQLLGNGYPDRSVILVVGPAGIGKEALRYWFTSSGLSEGDFCLYVTKSTPSEVLDDFRGFGVQTTKGPMWYSRGGGEMKFEPSDLALFSFKMKEVVQANAGKHVRIVLDVLSSLLVLHPMESVYRVLSSLFVELKQHDVVLVATLEEGMHDPKVVSTISELFDGVIEFKLYEEGLRVVPLLRIRKMRGTPPQPGYFRFSMPNGKMEIRTFVR